MRRYFMPVVPYGTDDYLPCPLRPVHEPGSDSRYLTAAMTRRSSLPAS